MQAVPAPEVGRGEAVPPTPRPASLPARTLLMSRGGLPCSRTEVRVSGVARAEAVASAAWGKQRWEGGTGYGRGRALALRAVVPWGAGGGAEGARAKCTVWPGACQGLGVDLAHELLPFLAPAAIDFPLMGSLCGVGLSRPPPASRRAVELLLGLLQPEGGGRQPPPARATAGPPPHCPPRPPCRWTLGSPRVPEPGQAARGPRCVWGMRGPAQGWPYLYREGASDPPRVQV